MEAQPPGWEPEVNVRQAFSRSQVQQEHRLCFVGTQGSAQGSRHGGIVHPGGRPHTRGEELPVTELASRQEAV